MAHARRRGQRMTEVPRGLTARHFIRALQADGFSFHAHAAAIGSGYILAYHALSDTFPVGTLKAMIADIGWTEADLRRLGSCRRGTSGRGDGPAGFPTSGR